MSDGRSKASMALRHILQIVACGLIALTALGLVIATGLAMAGVIPWLQAPLQFGSVEVANGGMILQVALTVLFLLLCSFLPSSLRVMRLEQSHRNFQLRMEDVSNAYWAVHKADRTGIFKMSSEFDAVKERILFLRDHPELHALEPEVMEIAAQMGQQSQELADIYSDEAIVRAKEFLEQRMHEVDRMSKTIDEAHAAEREIRQWLDEVERDEEIVQSRIERLRGDLDETLGRIGLTTAELTESAEPTSDVIFLPPAEPAATSANGSAMRVAAE